MFTIYTEDFGKLILLAKAERKINSKLRAGLELFYLSEIEFIQGKAQKTLTDAILIESFAQIRQDLDKLKTACRISETLDDLVKGEEQERGIWRLIAETFGLLDKWKSGLIYYYFLWNFLSVLGYQLELHDCIFCQRTIKPADIYLSFEEGGLICNLCAKKIKKLEKVDADIVKIIRIMLKKDLKTLKRLKAKEETLKSFEKLSNRYLFWVLEKIR